MIPRTLFLARGNGAVAWYRCALPATALGCDWLGLLAEPQHGRAACGAAAGPGLDDVGAYDVVVVQEARGPRWLEAIRSWREQGATVLYEVDDWLHGIAEVPDHALARHYGRDALAAYETCMRACDGMICSTAWLAARYRGLAPRTWVCRNGVDLRRFALTRPAREHVTVGWAGGTGHGTALGPWLPAVGALLRDDPRTRFLTVGDDHASRLAAEAGPQRSRRIPFSGLEAYPAAMAHFDIALAPAGPQDYFRAKSDLRWLEAAALGLPVIADPCVYADVEHGRTGLHARTPEEAGRALRELAADAALRTRIGEAARDHVREHRSARVAAAAWADALRAARAPVPAAA